MECVCGKKSSLGGVRQLFLQQLRQRRGRRQERVCHQSDSHHGNRDHRSWQGDPSTHCRCQKRAGILQQVHTFLLNRSLSVLCIPIVALRLCICKDSFFPFPSKLSPIQFNFHLLFFFFCHSHHSVCIHLQTHTGYSNQQSDGMFCSRCGMFSCSLKYFLLKN